MDLKKTVERLGGDFEALSREYTDVAGTLSKLGLSNYESRCYVALVALGPTSANSVAEIAHIPRTSAYKAIRALARKRYVTEQKGRPRLFSPADPAELSKILTADVERSFTKISKVKDLLSERGIPQLVYTIVGRDRVYEKIGDMFDKSEHTLIISTPSTPQLRAKLGKRFSNASARGVHVVLITSPFVKAPREVEVIRRKGLIATDIISDGKTALLAAPDMSACGYTDNEALSRHLEDFLKIMVERRE